MMRHCDTVYQAEVFVEETDKCIIFLQEIGLINIKPHDIYQVISRIPLCVFSSVTEFICIESIQEVMYIFHISQVVNRITPELLHFIRTALVLSPPEPATIEFMKQT